MEPDKPALGAVVVPTTASEIEAIVGNMAVWARPAHRPSPEGRSSAGPRLVFVFNRDPGTVPQGAIVSGYEANGLSRYFSGLEVLNLTLSGHRDVYERDYSQKVGPEGYKAGPNHQFFLTLDAARSYGACAFLMETDCAPIRPGWLERLMSLCEHRDGAWIMGSAYRGVAKLDPRFARHINGNAIYSVGDPDFQRFVRRFWEPRTKEAVADEDRRLAYDCVLERSFNSPEYGGIWQETAHRFRYTDVIQNISAQADLEEDGASVVSRVRATSPRTFIVHNANAASALRARVGASLEG